MVHLIWANKFQDWVFALNDIVCLYRMNQMDTFIARQPIFDIHKNVFAYELLFRSGWENFFSHDNIDQASSKVIGDSVLVHGLDTLTAGKKGFYNLSRETLVEAYYTVLPKEDTVVEILEDVEPDADVIRAAEKVKEAGYTLALDDFVYNDHFAPLLELADIIKVDFLLSDRDEQAELAARFAPKGIKMLGEKLETWEMYQDAIDMGYVYFQGYFFSKPTVLTRKDVPAFKLHYLEILREIQKPDLDYSGLEKVIKMEMSLSYKLLRYINSAFFGWKTEISSINHVLVLMGETDVKKWASLMVLSSMADDKPDELVIQAVFRAKFSECLAPLFGLGARSQDFFLMGMFSLIDAIIDTPLDEILDKLPIAEEIKLALLEQKGRMGEVHQLVLAYEQGNWKEIADLTARFKIEDEGIPDFYLGALEWANQSFKGAGT